MNIRDLRYLAVLAETCHFGRAAELCFVSQPTLSAQIRKLEDELGVTVFERDNRSVALTDAGKAVIVQTRIALEQIDQQGLLRPRPHGWPRLIALGFGGSG